MLIFLVLILFLVFALASFIIQFITFPVVLKFIIEPYYEEHPDEDVEKRRDIGLLPYEDPDADVNWGDK